MLRAIGPRFYVEAGFLILVAAVLAIQRVRPVEIVVVMLVAYVAVFSIELVLARRRAAGARQPESRPARVVADPVPVAPEPEEDVPSAIVAVRSAEPAEPVVVEVEASETEWVDDPPRRPVVASQPQPEPEIELVAAPEAPVASPALVVVPEPEPEPQVATPEPVVIASFPQQPRAWNLWELERLVRSRAGDDPLRDEEWGYLLVYLRDFASPEGVLSEDFDALVRESFGDLLEAAAAR